jgi:hypothetical protein
MRVFISGPLDSFGNQSSNVRQAVLAAAAVRAAGHSPLCPHLDHFAGMIAPSSYEESLRVDFDWIAVSEAIIRLPGASPGADREVAEAKRLGIPVYPGVKLFLAACPGCHLGKKQENLEFSS